MKVLTRITHRLVDSTTLSEFTAKPGRSDMNTIHSQQWFDNVSIN